MKLSLPLFVLAALASADVASASLRGGNGVRVLREETSGTFLLADIEYEDGVDGPDQLDNIELPDGQILELTNADLPPGQAKKLFRTGSDRIILPAGTTISNGKADLKGKRPKKEKENKAAGGGQSPSLFDRTLEEERTPEQARNLAALRRNLAMVGTRTVLAVRIKVDDAEYGFTDAYLRDEVFGQNADGSSAGDQVNLRSQYARCSHDKLIFDPVGNRALSNTPAGGSSTSITNGVVTVHLPGYTASQGDSVLRNAVNAELASMFGVSSARNLATHVMHCMPPGAMSGIAYAYINSWNSVYSNQWCNYPSGQMHEIGHNINLAHSNEAGSYKDQTGFMGYSYSNDEQYMCFNNAKTWQLGWFDDQQETLAAGSNWSGTITSHINYSDGSGPPVVIKLGNVFIGFNWDKDHNTNTVEGRDQVTIQSYSGCDAQGENCGYAESELLHKLGVGGPVTVTGTSDTITVNSIDAGAGTADITINAGSPPPPPSPPPPSPSPPTVTPAPTNAPTPQPTPAPTPNPTPNPTDPQPTDQPTPQPTNQPTDQPTPPPTPAPTFCTIQEDFESFGAAADATVPSGWTPGDIDTCSTGMFVLGTPNEIVNSGVTTQLGGDHSATPSTGKALFTASNTGAGTEDVDGGMCSVTSPTWAVPIESELSLWYFFGQRDAGDDLEGDYCRVELSLDGGLNWDTLASIGDVTSNAAWTQATAVIPAGSDVKLRVMASDGAGPGDLVEAGIDDITICGTGTSPPTQQPTSQPTNSPSTTPTAGPSKSPTDQPTPQPTPSPSENPTSSPSKSPSKSPTPSPVVSTSSPSKSPTPEPTPSPSVNPSSSPSKSPSKSPTPSPVVSTSSPSKSPTPEPTPNPTTAQPTNQPTPDPTTPNPTPNPTTAQPTDQPTPNPTTPNPTPNPTTAQPTDQPTPNPTTPNPTPNPTTAQPTNQPTPNPTTPNPTTPNPTPNPTTAQPTDQPTPNPTTPNPTPAPTPAPVPAPSPPSPTGSPPTGSPPTTNCVNDPSWTYTTRSGKTKTCDPWVRKKPDRRCNKIGAIDGAEVSSFDACPAYCNPACL
ncbi:hypothetical protein ACHAXT_010861 [Thalassiosira profunda]